MLLYAPRYCLTASAGILACGQRKRTGSNPRIACPQSRFARRYSQHLAVCDSHFRRCVLFQATKASIVVCCRRYQSTKTPSQSVGLLDRMGIITHYHRCQPTKVQLQGSGCAADRASRSDDETGREAPDQACLILEFPVLFHEPLKLTIYRPSQTGGNTEYRPANQHRREVFFAAFC